MQKLIEEIAWNPHNLFVLGSVGSGKTALTFKIVEKAHQMNPDRPVYIHHYPDEAKEYLPEYFNFVDNIKDVPYNAIIAKDDTSLDDSTHSKGDKKAQRGFAQEMALCRQKRHSIIFTVQNTAWLSLDLERAGNNHYAYKWYDARSIEREREDVRSKLYALMEVMKKYLEKGHQRQTLAYIDSEFGNCMMTSTLPSFWSQDLSEILGRAQA